jgi:hypothetical protein
MPPPNDRGAGISRQLRRNGPLILIVALLLGVGAVTVLGGDSEPEPERTDAGGAGPDSQGAPEPTGRMPVTYAEAEEAGTVDDVDWGSRCDPETGRVRVPSVYAGPCVPAFEGDNGGATTIGVTDDTITVVRYVPASVSALDALIPERANDSQAELSQTLRDYLQIWSSEAELYGREIELVDFEASGPGDDVVAARADATQIASELKPFAVVGGPGLDDGAFASELTSHEIVCIECSGVVSETMADEMEPYVWGALPTAEQFLQHLGAWAEALGEAFDEEKAGYAGSEELRDQARRIGVVHLDQDPPIFAVSKDEIPEGIDTIESYVFDFSTMPQKATELMARFKSEGVTTVVFLGDPLMPIYLTGEATDQGYFPEWVFSGTGLTDTNLFGRQYDAGQMAHATGISQLPVPTTDAIQPAVRLYRWWFGGDDTMPPARGLYAAQEATARFLVNGIQMAGPDLTGETFAGGQFRIPPTGGGPTTPQVSYGNWGFFPSTDYSGIDDSVEIWWDGTVEAADETGAVGKGVWRRSHGGQRFLGEDDVPEPAPFEEDDSVTVADELTPEDTPPDYPPPEGAPAAP